MLHSESIAGVIDRQNAIISIQTGIINDLFLLLGTYLAAEELDSLPVTSRINEAAKLREAID